MLGRLERALAVAGEGHAPLECLQRFIERQVAALEALDELLELGQRLLEFGFFRGIFSGGSQRVHSWAHFPTQGAATVQPLTTFEAGHNLPPHLRTSLTGLTRFKTGVRDEQRSEAFIQE